MCDMQKMPSREDASCEEDSDMNFATFSPVGTAGTHFVTAGGQVPITKLQQNVANNGAGMPQVCVMGDGGVQYMRALDTSNTLQATPQLISVPVALPGAKPGDPQATVQIQVLSPNLLQQQQQQQPKYQMQIPIQGFQQVLTVAYSPDVNEAGGIQLVGQGSLGEGLQVLAALPQEMQLVQPTQEKEHVPINMPQVYITPNQQIIINGAEKAFNNNTTSDNHNANTIVIKEECDDDESSQGTEIGEATPWHLDPNHQQDIVKYLRTLPPQQTQALPESLQQFLRLNPTDVKPVESLEIEVENAVVTKKEEPVAEAVLSEGNIAGPRSNKRLHELNLQLNKDVCKHSKKKVVAAIANYINHLREINKRKARANSQRRLQKALPYYDGVVINLDDDDENKGNDKKDAKLNKGNSCRVSNNLAVSFNNKANRPNDNTMPFYSIAHARDHTATLINHESLIGRKDQPQVKYSPYMTNHNSSMQGTKVWRSNAQFDNFDYPQNSELDSMTDDEWYNYIARINYELNLQYYANKSKDSIMTKGALDSVEVKGTFPRMQNTTHGRTDPVTVPSYNVVRPPGEHPPITNARHEQSFAHTLQILLKSGSIPQQSLNDPTYVPQIKNVKEEEIFLKSILDFLDQSISSNSKLSEKDLAVQISEYISTIELTNHLELTEKFRIMIYHRLRHSLYENTEQSKLTPMTPPSFKMYSDSDTKYSDVKYKQEYFPDHKPKYEEFAQNSIENRESRDSKDNLLQNKTCTSNEVIEEKYNVMSSGYPQHANKSKTSVSNITTKGNFTKSPECVNEAKTHESHDSIKPEHNFKLVIFGEYHNKSKPASRDADKVVKPRIKLEHQLSTESGYESSSKQCVPIKDHTKISNDFQNKNSKSNKKEPPIYEISSDSESDSGQKHNKGIMSNKYTTGESDDSELLNTALRNIKQKTEKVFANDIDRAAYENGFYSAMLLDSIDLLDIPIPPGKPNDTCKTDSDIIPDTNKKTNDEPIIKLQSDRRPFTHSTWKKQASRNLTPQPLLLRVLDYNNVVSDRKSDEKYQMSKDRENQTSHNDTVHLKHKSHYRELTEGIQSKMQPDRSESLKYSKKPEFVSSKYEENIKRISPSKTVLPKYEPYQDRRLKNSAYTGRKHTENQTIRQLPEYSSELHSKNKALGSKLRYKDWDRIEESGSRCKTDTKDTKLNSHNTEYSKRGNEIFPLPSPLQETIKAVEIAPKVNQQMDTFDHELIKLQSQMIPTESVGHVPSPCYEVTIDSSDVQINDDIVHLEQSALLTNTAPENITENMTAKTTSDNIFEKEIYENDKCVKYADTTTGPNADVTNEINNYIENKTVFYYNNKMVTKIWNKNTIGKPKINILTAPIKYVTQHKQHQPDVENMTASVTNKTQHKGIIYLDYVPDPRKKHTKSNKTESEPSCENQSNLSKNRKLVRVPQLKGIKKILKERRLNRSLGFISQQRKSKTDDLTICPTLQKESKNQEIETVSNIIKETETNCNASNFSVKYIKCDNNTFQMKVQNKKVNIKIVEDPEERRSFNNNSLSNLNDNKNSLTKLDSRGNDSLPMIDLADKHTGLQELEYNHNTTKPVPLFDNNNYLLQPDSHNSDYSYQPTMPDPLRTDTYSENPDSPSTDTYLESPDSPRTDSYSEHPDSPRSDSYSENPDSPRSDSYLENPDSPRTDNFSSNPDSLKTDKYSETPNSPAIDTYSEIPNSPGIDTYSKNPDSHRTDKYSATADSPNIDINSENTDSPNIDINLENTDSPGINTCSEKPDSSRIKNNSENSDSLKTNTYSKTPNSPEIDTYPETPNSPGIDTYLENPDSHRIDKYSATADSPKTDINPAIADSSRTDTYSANPDSFRTDTYSENPNSPKTDTYSEKPNSSLTDTYSVIADSSRTDSYSQNPDSSGTDTHLAKPDSPSTDTHSANPDSPKTDTCSETPDLPRTDTYSVYPNPSRTDTYPAYTDSPRIGTFSETSHSPKTNINSAILDPSKTNTYSKTPNPPGIDTYSENPDSPITDNNSANTDSPKIDTYSETPDSSGIDTYSVIPDLPKIDTCTVTPGSPRTKCSLPIPINIHKNSIPMVVNSVKSLAMSDTNNSDHPLPEPDSSISDPKQIDVTIANNDYTLNKIPKLKILRIDAPAPHTTRLRKRTMSTYKCIECPIQEQEEQLTENTTNNDKTLNKSKQTSSEAKAVKPIKISKSQIFNLKGTPSLKSPRELLSGIDRTMIPTQTPSSNTNSVINKSTQSNEDKLQVTNKRSKSNDDNIVTHSCKKKIKLGKTQEVKQPQIKKIGTCTCFNKCSTKIKAPEQLSLCKKFHKLGSLEKQSLFLCNCLEIFWKIIFDPMEKNKRKYIVHYSLPNAEGKKRRVCKKFFKQTFLLSNDQLDELIVTRKKMMTSLPITKP